MVYEAKLKLLKGYDGGFSMFASASIDILWNWETSFHYKIMFL